MNELRAELEKMGPERVRRGMVAFDGGEHCFVWEGYGGLCRGRIALTGSLKEPAVECAFEGWNGLQDVHGYAPAIRADLYAECVAYLAEHGVAVEPKVNAPVCHKED